MKISSKKSLYNGDASVLVGSKWLDQKNTETLAERKVNVKAEWLSLVVFRFASPFCSLC